MVKTSKQIQGDVYRLLKDSPLADMLSGDVYREGTRPRDSDKEDAVVIFTAGRTDQIQTGVVTLNIYVPDIAPYFNGVHVENTARCEAIEAAAQKWVESLTAEVSCYKFELRETIHTTEAKEINQHFIVVRLGYKYFDNN